MSDVEFAVTEDYQCKVLAYMLQNPEFCDVVRDHMQVEHFNNKTLQWFFTAIAQSGHHLTPVTLREEMIRAANAKSIKQEEIGKFIQTFDIVKERVLPVEEDYIKDKVGMFIRAQSVKQALMDSVELAKAEQWDDIVGMMQEAVAAGMNLDDQGYDYLGVVAERIYDRAHERVHRKIPSAIPDLDALTFGGIKQGQMGMIVGGTGRGKSIFLQWLASAALLLNKKVVYFTFELGKRDIADRFDSMFAEVKPQELNDYQTQVLEKIENLHSTYGKSLLIQHYPADTATINTLKEFCRARSQEGIVPDLIIIDYLDLMKPHREYHSEHAEIDAITKGIIGFAAEFDVAVWTATQLNRAGMVSETPDEAGMAGYVGKQYHADIVLWLAQTKEEKEEELMRIWVSKNRNGPFGRTIHLETNYSYMKFYERSVAKPDETQAKATKVLKKSTKEAKAKKAAKDSAAAAEIKDDLATALLNAVGKDDD